MKQGEIEQLHERFKDKDSPSADAQVTWLKKQGFTDTQITQAMTTVYTDIKAGDLPKAFLEKLPDGTFKARFGSHDSHLGDRYESREIKNGFELCQVILAECKKVRTDESKAIIRNIEIFEENLHKKWKKQVPWYKRVFGVKPE